MLLHPNLIHHRTNTDNLKSLAVAEIDIIDFQIKKLRMEKK
jgi:hypothetical protein